MISTRFISALILLFLTISQAHASPESERKAFEIYQDARMSYEDGKLKESVVKLEQAFLLFPHPIIALQLAEILEKLGQPERALEVLEKVRARDANLKSKIDLRSKALRTFLSQPLKVSIFSNVPATTIVIDGNKRRTAPVEIELSRGIHQITSIATGYRRIERTINVRGSAALLEKFEMQALTGTLTVKVFNDDLSRIKIRVDGQDWTLRPHELAEQITDPRTLQVGKHQLTCWKQNETKDVRTFIVREGEDVSLLCRSGVATASSARRIWGWITAGTGIASVAAGVVLFWSYREDIEKADQDPDIFIKSTNKHIFAGVFGLASIGLGVTSYWLFNSTHSPADGRVETPSSRAFQITPLVGKDFGGIGAFGRF